MDVNRSHRSLLLTLSLAVVLLACAPWCIAQTPAPTGAGGVEGVVLDVSGKPCRFANVVVIGHAGWGAMAGEKGLFSIRNLPAGVYSLRATYPWSEALVSDVLVITDRSTRVDFLLQRPKPPDDIPIPTPATSDSTALFYGALVNSDGYSLPGAGVYVDGRFVVECDRHGVFATEPMRLGTHVVGVRLGQCGVDSAATLVLLSGEKKRLDLRLEWDWLSCEGMTITRSCE
jgi:hypothetical protein